MYDKYIILYIYIYVYGTPKIVSVGGEFLHGFLQVFGFLPGAVKGFMTRHPPYMRVMLSSSEAFGAANSQCSNRTSCMCSAWMRSGRGLSLLVYLGCNR